MPLKLTINPLPKEDTYDYTTGKCVKTIEKPIEVTFEHSLISIAKWETIHEVPYLDPDYQSYNGRQPKKHRTVEELKDYIRCMIVTPKEPSEELMNTIFLSNASDLLGQYISRNLSADKPRPEPKLKEGQAPRRKTPTTSDTLYFLIYKNQIPGDVDKWPINRLLILLDKFAEAAEREQAAMNNGKGKGKVDMAARKAENDARRKLFNTRG